MWFNFRSLPNAPQTSLDKEKEKVNKVSETVKSTKEIMSQLGKDLASSKEWAQTLPKLADDAQKMTANIENLRKYTFK